MAELVIGVDSSTQSTKVQVHDSATGALVGTGRAAHPSTTPPVSEQDPGAWWSALAEAIGQLGDLRAGRGGDRRGRTAARHGGHRRRAAVLRPAKLWNDTDLRRRKRRRSSPRTGPTGGPAAAAPCPSRPSPSPSSRGCIEHEPATAASIASVMLPHDYLTWRLTGDSSPTVATRRAPGTGRRPTAGTSGRSARPRRAAADGRDARGARAREPAGRSRLPWLPSSGCRRPSWSARAPATTWPPRSASALVRATSPSRSAPPAPSTRSATRRPPTRRARSPGSPTPRAASCRSSAR